MDRNKKVPQIQFNDKSTDDDYKRQKHQEKHQRFKQIHNQNKDKFERQYTQKRNQNVFLYSVLLIIGISLSLYWTLSSLQLERNAKIDKSDIWKYQTANFISFFTCFIVAISSRYWQIMSYSQCYNNWLVMITPTTETYGIWGVIYIFQFCFTIYQAIPSQYADGRNDDLIYGQIGAMYTVLMSFQCLYFIVWQFSNATAFLATSMMVLTMLSVSIVILQYSLSVELNAFEFYFLRLNFSVFTSWMILEFIVSIFYVIKAAVYYGHSEIQMTSTESSYTVYVLWLMFVVYNVYAYLDFNPLFGCVFIWALLGIRLRNDDNLDYEIRVHKHASLILKIYCLTFVGQITLTILNITWVNQKHPHGLIR